MIEVVATESLVELSSEIDVLEARQAQQLSRWLVDRTWADNGCVSAAQRLANETEVSVAQARCLIARARKTASMTLSFDAWREGSISTAQFDLLTSANQPKLRDEFASAESYLLEAIKTLRHAQALRVIKRWIAAANESLAEDEASKRFDDRHAQMSRTLNDCQHLDAWFDPMGGEIFHTELERLERGLFEQDWAEAKLKFPDREICVEDLKRTPAQRRLDALTQMAKRSAGARGDGAAVLNVIVGEDAFRRVCELSNGVTLTPGQVATVLDTASIEAFVFDGPRKVIETSKQRLFTGSLRRAIEVRDLHCQDPSGCDEPIDRCQVDHNWPWVLGGETSEQNGQLLCRPHNDQKGYGPAPPSLN